MPCLRPATLLKKRLWHRCFPVNFAKFLRTPFFQNTSGRLLLYFFRAFTFLYVYMYLFIQFLPYTSYLKRSLDTLLLTSILLSFRFSKVLSVKVSFNKINTKITLVLINRENRYLYEIHTKLCNSHRKSHYTRF